jgi:hypothetical protein
MGRVVKVTTLLLFIPQKRGLLHTLQEADWDPGLVGTGAENLALKGARFPDRPACSKLLYCTDYVIPTYTWV